MMNNNIAVRVDNLSKKYKGKTVLNNVSFELEKGSATALVGVNGSGKTTLMRILAGLVLADSGSISLLGSETGRELRRARNKSGFLIEAPIYYSSMSVKKNLAIRAGLYGSVDTKYIKELLKRMKLSEREVGNGRISLLSYGQKSRYGILSALVSKPELIVLDEPFNGLDEEGADIAAALLNELRYEHGVTILISGHIDEQLERVCTERLLFENGSVSKLEHIEAAEEAGTEQ